MTYMAVTNDRDEVGLIDLGEFDGDDVWDALFALDNGGIYAHVETCDVLRVCEERDEVRYLVDEYIENEDQAIEFFGRH